MSGGSSAPMAYTPGNQPGQDANYNAITQNQNTLAANLAATTIPNYRQIYQNIQADPYYNQQMEAALQVGQQGQNVATMQGTDATALNAAGQQGLQYAAPTLGMDLAQGQQAWNQAQSLIPQATAGLGYAPGVLNTGLNNANTSWGQSQATLGAANSAANTGLEAGGQILNTAFDPQQALYNQQYQQMMEQTNAINAQNGVSGSPFAAGLGAQNANNFNINWQNAQLGRQEGALGAFDSAASTAFGDINSTLSTGASDYSNLSSSAVNNFNSLTNTGVNDFMSLLTGGAGVESQLQNAGTGAYGSLLGTAAGADTASSALANQSLQTWATTAALPNETFLNQQQSQLNALNAMNQGDLQAIGGLQNGVNNAGTYLGIGQNATQINDAATQQNNQQQQQFWSGLTNLLGMGTSALSGGGGAGGASGLLSMLKLA